MSKSRSWAKINERRLQSLYSFDAYDEMTCIGVFLAMIFNNACKMFSKFETTDQETDFTPKSKRWIEAKIKK